MDKTLIYIRIVS